MKNKVGTQNSCDSGIGESTGFVWDADINVIQSLTANHVSESESDDEEEVMVKKRKRRTARLEREEELNLHQVLFTRYSYVCYSPLLASFLLTL